MAAVIIHSRKLELIEGAKFSTFIKPPFDWKEMNPEVLAWHADIRKTTPEEVLKLFYENTPTQETAWASFRDFIRKYHNGSGNKTIFNAPIRAGANIISFDNVLWQRLCERHKMVGKDGLQNLVMGNRNIDTMNLLWPWFEDNPELDSLAMDNLRPYFGISKEGGHDAFKDVDDSSAIIMRFLKYHRLHASRTNFKGAFAQ